MQLKKGIKLVEEREGTGNPSIDINIIFCRLELVLIKA